MGPSRQVLIVFAVLAALCASHCGKNATVPDELVGVWRTSASQYRDGFFELKKEMVIFGTGRGKTSINSILRVESSHQDNEVLYTILYESREGQEYKWSFYYLSANGGVIRFKNQPQIEWTRGG